MTTTIINLQEFRTPNSKVFTGRDRGLEVREKSKIDQLANQYDKIVLTIPEDIRSINPSFLEEFLFNVVTNLGKDGFYRRFEIENSGRYKIEEDLNKAIERIIREENALS